MEYEKCRDIQNAIPETLNEKTTRESYNVPTNNTNMCVIGPLVAVAQGLSLTPPT
jgi:hypothetical protein